MSDITKFCLKPEHEEILKKRPRAPWIDDVPEGDHITPYPTYEVGKLFHLFDEAYYENGDFKMKYYFFDPIKNGYDDNKKHPILIFLHGTSNALVGDVCINYTGAELYASESYQKDLGGAYILIPVANEYRAEDGHVEGAWSEAYSHPTHDLIMDFISRRENHISKRILLRHIDIDRVVINHGKRVRAVMLLNNGIAVHNSLVAFCNFNILKQTRVIHFFFLRYIIIDRSFFNTKIHCLFYRRFISAAVQKRQ